MPEMDTEVPVEARPFWSGTISFGLVSVPVNLLPANRSDRASLRMLSPEGHPLARRYFSEQDNRLLDWDDIVRGYEIEKNKYVIIDDEELEKLAPERTRDIDLQVFAKVSDVDPMHFERAYYLTPAGESNKAYRLLAQVMEDSERVGIATFVMRGKEYLIAIIAEKGILRAETLRFVDEVRTPAKAGLPEPGKADTKATNSFIREITKLSKPRFDPKELTDEASDRLEKLARKKAKAGKDVVHFDATKDEEGSRGVIDLMALLRKSLENGGDVPEAANEKATNAESGKAKDLAKRTREELYQRAQELGIPGRASMTKEELVKAIRKSA